MFHGKFVLENLLTWHLCTVHGNFNVVPLFKQIKANEVYLIVSRFLFICMFCKTILG